MLAKLLIRLGDFVFVLRPVILIPAWSFFLLGAAAARSTGQAVDAHAFRYALAALTCILACAYLLNQVFDQDSDRENDKCHHLSRGIFQARTLVLMAFVAFLAASRLSRGLGSEQRILLLAALTFSLAYSLPPVRLVSRPFADLAANAVGYGGLAYLLGFSAGGAGHLAEGMWRSVPFVLLVGATFLHTTVLDFQGDRTAGKRTTTVRIGIRRSLALAALIASAGLAASIVSAIALGGRIAPLVLAPATAAVWIGFLRAKTSSSTVVLAATAVVTLGAAIFWPLYGGLVVALVLISRAYYRSRFSIAYPGPMRRP